MNKKPLVSVVMITYGHEKYIEEAINGVLMQNCNFDIELILSNDCSPDGTDTIVKSIIKNHSKSCYIKYIKHETNLGMMPNFIFALKKSSGTYIALCEGDDYWTDPLKLQKQVDFLEKNVDFNMVTSKFKFYYHNSGIFKNSRELINIKKDLFLKDYLAYNFSHTSTFLFRNNFTIPNWLQDVHAGDQSIFIIASGDKKIKYFDEFHTVYRINDFSISNNVDACKSRQKTFYFLTKVNEYTNKKYNLLIEYRKKISNVAYCFEKTNNKVNKIFLRYILLAMRWFGCNVLVRFVK